MNKAPLEALVDRVNDALKKEGFADRRSVRILRVEARRSEKEHVVVRVSERLLANRGDVHDAIIKAGLVSRACPGGFFELFPDENKGIKVVLRDVARCDFSQEVGSIAAASAVVRHTPGYRRGYIEKNGELIAWLEREDGNARWTSNHPVLDGLDPA